MIEIRKAGENFHSDPDLDTSFECLLDINNNRYDMYSMKIKNLYFINCEDSIRIQPSIVIHIRIAFSKRLIVTPFRKLSNDFKFHYEKIYESFNIKYYNP